jgi:Ca2+-binding EF-hand superfamily protein
MFANRMFRLFDKDGNGSISFEEFAAGLSVFNEKASMDEKTEFSFKIYDFDGDGHISKKEMKDVLQFCLVENKLGFPEKCIDLLIDETFATANLANPGKMSLKEYKDFVKASPETMMQNMTVTNSTK